MSESLPVPNPPHTYKPMPNPTTEQLASPEFEAIWNVIKSWDVNAPEYYSGYCRANGSHVALILNALNRRGEGRMKKQLATIVFEAIGEASMCWEETPRGVFDSTHAKEIGEAVIQAIKEYTGYDETDYTIPEPSPTDGEHPSWEHKASMTVELEHEGKLYKGVLREEQSHGRETENEHTEGYASA